MAKAMKKNGAKHKAPGLSKLTMSLHAPGMSPLHRAGLGGLACTLRYIERQVATGRLRRKDVPGSPWKNGKPPWTVSLTEVILDFGVPEEASDFLQKLFQSAFALKDDLIYLPGQFGQVAPNLAVRAYLQQGMTLTFLQHGKVRKLAKTDSVCEYRPEGADGPTILLQYKTCSRHKHQSGWENLVDSSGKLVAKPVEVAWPLSPGAVVRHVAFTAQTKIEENATHILPLYFALVGCLALSINRGSGVLLVPDVSDLVQFCEIRPWMTPTTPRECQITSAGDAALQAQVRIRAKRLIHDNELPACRAITFRPTPWATQQKSRVQSMSVLPGEEERLNQFEVAMTELPSRIVSRVVKEAGPKGKRKGEKTEWFWADSIVRPLVADNLARGQPWYRGFVDLMTKMDASGKKPLREKLVFEKKGLHAMIEQM